MESSEGPSDNANIFDRTRQFFNFKLECNLQRNKTLVCKLRKLTILQFYDIVNIRVNVGLDLQTNIKTEIPLILTGYYLNLYHNVLLKALIRG
jgi:hypothetical protein